MREIAGWDAELAIRMTNDGRTQQDIAAHFGIAPSTASKYLRLAGIPPRRHRIPADVSERIAIEYASGLNMPELSRRYDTTCSTVSNILKRYGVKARDFHDANRKYRVNEEAFINAEASEHACYHIGFLMADGCISDTDRGHKKLLLALAARDVSHIESLLTFLDADYPICRHEFTRESGYVTRVRSISIPSNLLCDTLCHYGVTPRKTRTAKFHDSLAANRHAFRGLIDGDGSIGLYRNRKDKSLLAPKIALFGSWHVTNQFADFIGQELGFRLGVYPRPGCFCVQTEGRKAQKVIRLLYEGCDIALPRKLALANGAMALPLDSTRTKHSHIGPEVILALYEQHRSWVDVANALDITVSGLKYLRRKFQVHPTVHSRHVKVAHLSREELLVLRGQHGTWFAVAKHLEVSHQTLYAKVREYGIADEPPFYDKLTAAELRDLLDEHGTIARVARAIGTTWSNVGNLLKRRGVTYRGWKINRVTREELETLYGEHGSWLAVSKHLNVTDGAVYHLRQRLGMMD